MEQKENACSTGKSCANHKKPGGCADAAHGNEKDLDAFLEEKQLDDRMLMIRHKIIVMSGKGGVGKSTVAANLAVSLALAGRKVGLLDVDIHGPSIPKMLHIEDASVQMQNGAILPVEKAGMKIMSIGLLLQNRDDALIWRGPMKMGVIKQFLKDVDWGELDYLIIDSPPGTGDEPLSVCQLVKNPDGAVIVTTPQDVATVDVRKSINFCKQLKLPVLGVVENMSGFVCPKCGEITDIFKTGGGERMATDMGVPFLGRIPVDPAVGEACDAGTPFIYHYSKTETAKALERVVEPILLLSERKESMSETNNKKENTAMRIAIPIAEGKLCMHFGHCEQFALLDVDEKSKKITSKKMLVPPPHEPGVLPKWLSEQGANMIIAGGMGSRAQGLFSENGIKVVVGAPSVTPEQLVDAYMEGTLQTGSNTCDH